MRTVNRITFVTDPETGRRYPIPAGGAAGDPPAGDPPAGDPPADPDDPPADPPADPAPDDPDKLPDDHPVIVTMRREREERKKAEKRLADLEQAEQARQRDAMDEHERALAEAREEAANEVRSEFARERLADRVRVAAAKKLNDPEDAVRLLDLDGFDPSSDDLASEIEAALGSLVESKPYLAVSETPPAGSADARSRPDPGQPDVTQMTPAQVREWAKANR